MTSIREQILAALTTTLGSTSGVTAVYRSRAAAVARAEAPVLIVQPGPGRAQRHSTCKLHFNKKKNWYNKKRYRKTS